MTDLPIACSLGWRLVYRDADAVEDTLRRQLSTLAEEGYDAAAVEQRARRARVDLVLSGRAQQGDGPDAGDLLRA